jgi:hypothetical protein
MLDCGLNKHSCGAAARLRSTNPPNDSFRRLMRGMRSISNLNQSGMQVPARYIALTMLSVIFFASPRSIIVLSL